MSDNRLAIEAPANGVVDEFFPPLGNHSFPDPLTPLVELAPVTAPATSPWPFSDQPEARTLQPQNARPEPVITPEELKAACEKAYQDGYQAAREELAETQAQEAQAHEQTQAEQQQQGYTSGYQEGFARGLADGNSEGLREQREQFQDRQALLKQVTEQLETHASAINSQLTEAVMQLVTGLTREMLQAELKQQPETVQRIVRQALALLPRQPTHLRIVIHPDELPGLESLEIGHDLPFDLIADPSQEKGGCRILCDQAEVDASFQLRLEAYLESVRQILAKDLLITSGTGHRPHE